MDLWFLYFKTTGRISRKIWWLGAIPLVAAWLGLPRLLLLLLDIPTLPQIAQQISDGRSFAAPSPLAFDLYSIGSTIVTVGLGCLFYCLSVKRRHDRNSNGWDVAVLVGIPMGLSLLRQLFRFLPATANWLPEGSNLIAFLATGYLYQPFAIYVLVVLGLLRGNVADNDYGPTPVTPPMGEATT